MQKLYLSLRGLSPTPERLLHIIEHISLAPGAKVFLDWGESFPWSFECRVPEIYRYDDAIVGTIFNRLIQRQFTPVMVIPLAGIMPEMTSFHLYKAVRDHSQFDINALGHKKIIEDIIDDFAALETGCKRICLQRHNDIHADADLSKAVNEFVAGYLLGSSLEIENCAVHESGCISCEGTDSSGMIVLKSPEELLKESGLLDGDFFSTKRFCNIITQLIMLEQEIHLLYSSFRISQWKRNSLLKTIIEKVDSYRGLKKSLQNEVRILMDSKFVNRLPLSDYVAVQLNQFKGLPFDEALLEYL